MLCGVGQVMSRRLASVDRARPDGDPGRANARITRPLSVLTASTQFASPQATYRVLPSPVAANAIGERT